VFALRQGRDVVADIAQGAQLTAIGQRDRIVEGAVPALVRHQFLIPFSTTKCSGSSGSASSSIRLLQTGQDRPAHRSRAA
jgi:hypothetical protein